MVQLPGCLNFFQNTDGKCEHSIKVARPLLLAWENIANKQLPFGKTSSNLSAETEMYTQHTAHDASEFGQEEEEEEDNMGLDIMFDEDGEDLEGFFDFTESMKEPDCMITFDNMRML